MNALNIIKAKVQEQLNALNAEEYRITLRSKDVGFIFYDRLLKSEEVIQLKNLSVLDKKNLVKKMNVYLTPISEKYDYWLIDDVSEEKLKQIKKKFNICCLIESSDENFQIILKTPFLNVSDNLKNEYFKKLNKQYGDPKIAGYPHSFRLVGFKNVKEKYLKKQTGHYPIVSLIFCKNECCKIALNELKELGEYKPTQPTKNLQYNANGEVITPSLIDYCKKYYEKSESMFTEPDYSRIDYALLNKLVIQMNVSIDNAMQLIAQCSPHLNERHRDVEQYLQITEQSFLNNHNA